MDTNVFCPLIDKKIDVAECIENVDCIDGYIALTSLPEMYKIKENYKDICKNCKHHNTD